MAARFTNHNNDRQELPMEYATPAYACDEHRAIPDDRHLEFAVMDHTGDTKTVWDTGSDEEIEEARKQFDSFVKRGYTIFYTDKKGEKAEKMKEFKPTAGRMIAVKPIVAG
jgi:hypothetical protein